MAPVLPRVVAETVDEIVDLDLDDKPVRRLSVPNAIRPAAVWETDPLIHQSDMMTIDPIDPYHGTGGRTVPLGSLGTRIKAAINTPEAKQTIAAPPAPTFVPRYNPLQPNTVGTALQRPTFIADPHRISASVPLMPGPSAPLMQTQEPITQSFNNNGTGLSPSDQVILEQMKELAVLRAQIVQQQSQAALIKSATTTEGSMTIDTTKEAAVTTITRDEAKEIVDLALSRLGIPGLKTSPTKPGFRVLFDLGPAGQYAANYHWVCEHGQGLFLVYDKRFEYGVFYSPPYRGQDNPIAVSLPDLGKTYRCYSLDFVHPFGVFEIINLAIALDETKRGSLPGEMNSIAADILKEPTEEDDLPKWLRSNKGEF